jgi:hypothetical protein
MQYYKLAEDSSVSSKLLPDYALAKVNLREGWQIISDIGHVVGVTWEGQNKVYSPYHAKTRTFWKTKKDFLSLCIQYEQDLIEYETRMGENRKYFTQKTWSRYQKLYSFFIYNVCQKIIKKLPEQRNSFEMDLIYLLDRKKDKLTEEEIKRLDNINKHGYTNL